MKKTLMTAALLAAMTVTTVSAEQRMRLIAHRGESMAYPENTMTAFRAAVEGGADGLELDIYLTKDDGLICLHDDTTKRTTGVDIKPIDATAAELQTLDAGAFKGAQFKGERMPTLAEALTVAQDGFEIIVEIKGVPVDKLHLVVAVVKAEPKATPARVLFHCFNDKVVAELRKQLPDYRTYWLTGVNPPKDGKPGTPIEALIARAKDINASGLNLNAWTGVVTQDMVNAVKAAGLSCHVWTVNSVQRAYEMSALGVESMLSDCAVDIKKDLYGGKK